VHIVASGIRRAVYIYNDHLRPYGYHLFEKTRMSGRPVYAARYVGVAGAPAIAAAKTTLAVTDPGYVAQQITRMEAAVYDNPGLAIGTAKELLESCAKTILAERSIEGCHLTQLVKLPVKELELTPDDVPDSAKGAAVPKIEAAERFGSTLRTGAPPFCASKQSVLPLALGTQ